ncbi:MAG: phospho-N-acetylmuramoyl-pentapeptide-transferase [Planctomyces sp.]|nr:phospho-N-acetylmuramoyl-pentapeptide-transferase [Planctomyces sp.]
MIEEAVPKSFVLLRTFAAFLTALVVTLLMGPLLIRWLKTRFRERIVTGSSRLNELHAAKKETPTMGGVLIMLGVAVSSVAWCNRSNLLLWLFLLLAVGLTLVGGLDDWIKATTKSSGISARRKLILQCVMCLPSSYGLYEILKQSDSHLTILFIPWGVLVLVATSNSVNLTDGLDGLATGVCLPVILLFVTILIVAGSSEPTGILSTPAVPGTAEVAVLMAGLGGAMTGFLWFNGYPAQVFMGDAGSLSIGGLIGFAALSCRQEFLLLVAGGVLVAETLSVIVQVAGFKLTGRRLLRCSPLHHHFVFGGVPEGRIVVRFWIVSGVLAMVGLLVVADFDVIW